MSTTADRLGSLARLRACKSLTPAERAELERAYRAAALEALKAAQERRR